MSSILADTKHMLGLLPDETAFDQDVIIHINSVFTTLTQLGLGPVDPITLEPLGFMIAGPDEDWNDFIPDSNMPKLNAVKSYMFLRVKLMFDPPPTGFVLASMERQILELEWRLNVVVDYG